MSERLRWAVTAADGTVIGRGEGFGTEGLVIRPVSPPLDVRGTHLVIEEHFVMYELPHGGVYLQDGDELVFHLNLTVTRDVEEPT